MFSGGASSSSAASFFPRAEVLPSTAATNALSNEADIVKVQKWLGQVQESFSSFTKIGKGLRSNSDCLLIYHKGLDGRAQSLVEYLYGFFLENVAIIKFLFEVENS